MQHPTLKFLSGLLLIILFSSCNTDGLNLSDDKEIKITQRGTEVIKGSEGKVELTIGDITAGSTEVMLEGIENEKVYFKKQMSVGDEGYFQYGKYYYRIKINKFENHTFHDDFAFIAFRKASEKNTIGKIDTVNDKKETAISADEIRNYLNKIKTSKLKFIRNGEIWTDTTMSAHLENKYMLNHQDIKTKEDFIDKVINSSSLTGESYKVIINKNDTLKLVDWLKL
jgi:hypothetical protein